MRITPILLAIRNVIETYRDRTILYSLFPAAFLVFANLYSNDIDKFGLFVGLALVFGSMDCSILREKERGAITKLFLSNVSRWSITGGRLLSSVLLTLVKATLILSVIYYGNLMPEGIDLLWIACFYAVSCLITLLSVSLGLLCFSLYPSLKSSTLLTLSLLSIFAVLPAFFLDGSQNGILKYNPFNATYGFLEKLIKDHSFNYMFLVDDMSLVSIWIVLLYFLASISLRKKVA
jgi:ABC-type Na+ efflux pump permease subunit